MVGEVNDESEGSDLELHPPTGALEVRAKTSGFMVQANEPALLKIAQQSNAVIALQRPPGDFVVEGIPVARVWSIDGPAVDAWPSEESEDLGQAVNDAITIGFERNSVQDVGFPLQQLLDVAVRAISPSVNDPTTCVHALGHLAAGLSTLGREDRGHRLMRGDDGRIRVFLKRRTFATLLELVVSQICTYGIDDPRVARRLVQLLADIEQTDGSARHGMAIREQRQRVVRAVAGSTLDPIDRHSLLEECGATG